MKLSRPSGLVLVLARYCCNADVAVLQATKASGFASHQRSKGKDADNAKSMQDMQTQSGMWIAVSGQNPWWHILCSLMRQCLHENPDCHLAVRSME